MPQSLRYACEAILQSLIETAEATAAALVLVEGATETPHLLAQVGRLTPAVWVRQFRERPPDVFLQPFNTGRSTTSAFVAIHAAGRLEWDQMQQSLSRATALSLERLFQSRESEFDWRQLTASHRILPVTEEELCRIVLDIHDGPVQKLFSALSHVSHLQYVTDQALTQLPDPHAQHLGVYQETLDRVAGLLEASLTEIRTFLGTFHPPEFKQRSLLDVLEGLIIQHEELTGTTVHFEASATLPEISPPVKIALYRILQEALSNGVRHAGVNEHFVYLWFWREDLYLEVVDFGPGFEPPRLSGPAATERTEHIGLRGMRDRAQLVGGTFELMSRPGQGTRIKVCVPAFTT